MYRKIHLALILVSSAVIAYQIVLMEIFSITQWYHFAFMIISLALLGFGASGSLLAVYREFFMKHSRSILPGAIVLSALLTAVSVPLTQCEFVRFDTYLLFSDPRHILKLVLTCIMIFIPFFFAALSIGLIFTVYSEQIGMIYFSNMLGSGIGGIFGLLLLNSFDPYSLSPLVAIPALVGGSLLIDKAGARITMPLTFLGLITILFFMVEPVDLKSSQYKSLSKTMNLPDAVIKLERNSPYGFLQLVESDYIRHAPGLSLSYKGDIAAGNAAFINGNWAGPVIPGVDDSSKSFFRYTADALVYELAGPDSNNILILNSGTGEQAARALQTGPDRITLVEPNSALNSLLINEMAEESDSLYYNEKVELREISSRTFLNTVSRDYDIILLPMVGSFGGTSGTEAVKEDYLLTVESFNSIFAKLNYNGFYSVSCWLDYPYRNPLKLLQTVLISLNESGLDNPEDHIIAVRSWGTVAYFVKKSEITDFDINTTKEFCGQMYFDPFILQGVTGDERNKFNKLHDSDLLGLIDTLFSGGSSDLIDDYAFRIDAPTDDKPYFYQFINPLKLEEIIEFYGGGSLPYFELGYMIVILTLIILVILSVALIIIPLLKLGWKGSGKEWTIIYFSGLGLGYMFIEIVLIQKFALYLGHPILSASAVISLMLVCSGIGSLVSSKLKHKNKFLFISTALVFLILLSYNFILDSVLVFTISEPISLKIITAIFIIGVPGFFMGIPFPLGISRLNKVSAPQIPWAWGINGSLSVISTALAVLLSVELGFTGVFITAAAAYGFSSISSFVSN